MYSEPEEKIESTSQAHDLGLAEVEISSFGEYRVSLEDNAIDQFPKILPKSNSRKSKDISNHHFEQFAAVGESHESDDNNTDENRDRLSPDPDQNQAHTSQVGSRNPNDDEPVQSSRRISFVNNHNHSILRGNRNHNTPAKQNRSLEIRMDGHIVLVAHSNDVKSPNASHATSGNIKPIINPSESTRLSPALVKLDSGIADIIKNDRDRCDGRFQQDTLYVGSHQDNTGSLYADFSFNSATSSSPAAFRLSSQTNISALSSEGTLKMKPLSYSTIETRTHEQGSIIPEENAGAGTSFDESDVSSTTGMGLSSRFKDIFNMHTISVVIVKWIPYVCFSCFRNNTELQGNAFSDRFILARLNILSFVFSAVQLVACLWLIAVVYIEGRINYDDEDYISHYSFWNNNASIIFIGCLALLLIFTCFRTTRIVTEVDLAGALRFLWILLWILPIAAFFNIAAFDYHEVSTIWIRHNWNSIQLWWFRNQLCLPETAESLCMVPINGGVHYMSEDDWCLDRYSVTGCTQIRDDAQKKTTSILLIFYRSLASWGCIYMFILLLIIKTLERIISKPTVQKSREVNVVGWLTFPVFWTALYGSVIVFSPYTYLDKLTLPRCVGYLYLITSALFVVALLMGWLLSAFSIRSNVDKQNKSKAALILVVVLFINAFVLLAILITSAVWSFNLELNEDERGDIACTMSSSECTNCDAGFGRCPEWSSEEITKIVRRQLKESAVVAAIFILYDVNVMIHGFNLRKYLTMYQIDYV